MILLIFILGFGLAAHADDEPKAPQVIYRKTEKHDFSGLKLKGQLKKPELSYIYKRKGLRSEKIIDIPENFDVQFIEAGQRF